MKTNVTAGAPSFLVYLCDSVPTQPCLNQRAHTFVQTQTQEKGIVIFQIILLLTLTFGPCLINKFVTFVKSRLEKMQLMVMKQSEMEMKIMPNESPELDAACDILSRFNQQITYD